MNKDEQLYKFPKWVTQDMKDNFFGMWGIFGRNYDEYENNRINNKMPKNGTKVYLQNGKTGEKSKGEFFFKWNNIGWVFDGIKAHHVSSGGALLEVKDLSKIKDDEITFIV